MKLMAHLIAGYPTLKDSKEIAIAMAEAGADILEIQLPFSDPIADGPVIAQANAEALKKGVSTYDCLKMIQDLKSRIDIPIVIMTYFNVVFKFGIKAFCKMASEIGVGSLIIPDYSIDEEAGNGLIQLCRQYQLNFIPVIAPNTRPARLKAILEHGSGFIYCVARSGTTGDKTKIDEKLVSYLQSIRTMTDLSLAVGFGISERVQIKALEPYADIAVVGSALMREYQDRAIEEGLQATKQLIFQLK